MNVEIVKTNIRENTMLIEITPESRFQLDNIAISLKHMAIVKPNDLKHQFIKDNRLILSEEAILIVKKIRSKVKYKILEIDTYRKQLEKERKNRIYYTSSSNIRMNDYNNSYVSEFICGQLRYGI